MANNQRDPGREAFWRGVLKRWKGSGLSVRAFCRREALGESNFYAWRRTIARRDAQPKRSAPRNGRAMRAAGRNVSAKRVPAFVPMVVSGESQGEAGIVIELAGGRRLLLPEAIAARRLAAVVHALEAEASETGTPRTDVFRAGAER